MRLTRYLTETIKSMTLYHATKPENMDKIISKGFDLSLVKPRYKTDYAISAAKSKKDIEFWFGDKSNIKVLKFKFKGNIVSIKDKKSYHTLPMIEFRRRFPTAQDYTKEMLKQGIDALDAGTIFIYNTNAISNIEINETD